MQNELSDDQTVGGDDAAAAMGAVPNVCDDPALVTAQTGDEQVQTEPADDADDSDDSDDSAVQEPPAETETSQAENQVKQSLDKSPAEIVIGLSGNDAKLYSNVTHNHYDSPADKLKDLAPYISITPLPFTKRSYQSISDSDIDAHVGLLLTQRILILSCRSKIVALNLAKSIAHKNGAAGKQLVTIQANCEGAYTLKDLIEHLVRHEQNDGQGAKRSSQRLPGAVWVWEANDVNEGSISDISNTILDSLLFVSAARVDQYQNQLSDNGLCLICLIPPLKLQDYKRSNFDVDLPSWEIDFLCPMLEESELSGIEELAPTIVEQRRQGKWDADDAEFCKEIGRYLRARNLPAIVAGKKRGEHVDLAVERLFDRRDPLADTVMYCATFYPDLSPQDFFQLVLMFLGDAPEEVGESTDQPRHEGEKTQPPTLAQRWRRESDHILRRCKLFTVTDENNRRVVDYQEDGLRSRLSQYIRDDHYFFYESKFVVMRRQGLLFSPKKKIAEGARQLLVEMASQYDPDEVANWLYEIVYEFEQAAQAADLVRGRSQLFQLIPDARVKAARRYVRHGLSLILSRLNKEPDLQEAARLFWQKLLQSERHWFLDLLRQMGNSAPAETLRWVKQVLEQSTKEIRAHAHAFLLGYLLRRDTLIYTTLRELTQWPPDGQAGRAMHTLLIVYCVETNRRLPQREYGKWPSRHPLFGFQERAEARECMELLIWWVFTAAFEVDEAGGLSIIADIIAGWYFILSPPAQAGPAEVASTPESADDLDAHAARQLLLECLARHCSRSQKNDLLAIWESCRNNILQEVGRFEEFTSQLADISPSAKLMRDAAAARRKLMDTRGSLGRLRRDFMDSATKVVNG